MTTHDGKPERLAKERLEGVFGLLLVLTLLLGRLPYRGIRHDAILYAGQALAHLNPSWAASDFYFAHGSQDRYSIFSAMLAWLMRHVDTSVLDVTLLLGAQFAFLAVLVGLTREFPWRDRWLSLLCVVGATHFYASGRVFSFMEPFLTARTWAEPLTLLALLCLMRQRRVGACVAFAGAMLMHPLVAVPAMGIALVYLIGEDRRWALLLLALIPLLGLAAAGMQPFAGLFKVYDDDWFKGVLRSNDVVFLTNWSRTDLPPIVINAVVLWLATRGSATPLARLGRATLVGTPILCLVSFVGADLYQNVLITQLQLWRALWVLTVLSLLHLPVLLLREWRKGPVGRLAATSLFMAVWAADAWTPTGWVLVCWGCLALIISARSVVIKTSILKLAIVATVLVGAVLCGLQWEVAQEQLNMHQQGTAISNTTAIPFTMTIVTLPIAFGLMFAWRLGGGPRVLAALAAFTLLLTAAATWDQRSAWARYIESAVPGAHPFDAVIPPGAQVYWHEDPLAIWILLQRASFISTNQTSGLLFNRATTMDALLREPLLFAVEAHYGDCASLEMLGATSLSRDTCNVPVPALLNMCHAKPLHADFIVTPVDLGQGAVSRWTFAPKDGSPSKTYVLYDCNKVR